MRVDEFDFDLPHDLIALRPVVPRDAARLLVVREDGSREHRTVRDLPELLRSGDTLVVNDTRVIPARLTGIRLAREEGEGAKIEITLHKRVSASAYRAFARPAKRLKPGDRIRLGKTLTNLLQQVTTWLQRKSECLCGSNADHSVQSRTVDVRKRTGTMSLPGL